MARSPKKGKKSTNSSLSTLSKPRRRSDIHSVRANLEKARELAEAGKGAKTIVKKSGVSFDEARQIVKAHRESTDRKSHKEVLDSMLIGTRKMVTKAQKSFMNDPSGKSAYAVQALFSEQRAILEQLSKEAKPEEAALQVIQEAIQPFLKVFLQDVVVESRRAMQKCTNVVESEQQRLAIESSFQGLIKTIGSLASGHYGVSSERVCSILKCNIEDVKRLANESSMDDSLAVEDQPDNVINMKKRVS